MTNACRNSVTPDWSQLAFSMGGTASPSQVLPGEAVTLSNISQTVAVPGGLFVTGYNLHLLPVGANNVPATVFSRIDAPNTVEASRMTNSVETLLATTITDPDGIPGNGDETATDGTATVTYADEVWTAKATGAIPFAEHRDDSITGTAGGGFVAVAHIAGGLINVSFHCTPGTVAGPSPGTPAFSDGPAFAGAEASAPPPSDTPPVNTALPAISGITIQGQALSASLGSWSNSPSSFAFQWRRCDLAGSACTNIDGATAGQYALDASDVGHTIRVVVTATNAAGATPATSGATSAVAAPPRALTLTGVHLTSKSFLAKRGTTLVLELSLPATVTAGINRIVPGHRVHGRCRPSAKKGPRCTMLGRTAKRSFAGVEGTNRLKLKVKHLAPGRYALAVRAQEGSQTAKAVRLTFKVEKR